MEKEKGKRKGKGMRKVYSLEMFIPFLFSPFCSLVKLFDGWLVGSLNNRVQLQLTDECFFSNCLKIKMVDWPISTHDIF